MHYSPHLYVKTEQEIEEEERRRAARPPVTGSNNATIYVDERKGSAKRRELAFGGTPAKEKTLIGILSSLVP